MNKRLGTPVAALLALLAVPFATRAEEQAQQQDKKHKHYTLIDVGTLGGLNSFVIGAAPINEKGVVVGLSETAFDPICDCFPAHAFQWDEGTLTDLGTLPNGSSLSAANAVSSSGAIAGASLNGLIEPLTGTAAFDATLWPKKGEIVDLGTLGGSFSVAFALNDRGMAAGAATNTILDPDSFGEALIGFPSSTQWHAALWQNGSIQDLGTLGDGPASVANFVNERGQVAGNSYTNSIPGVYGIPTLHPFLWENGQMVDLGSLGGVYANANGLNNRGQVAGFSTLTGDLGGGHAFLWARGAMQDLGFLGGSYSFSEANVINDDGEIAGHSATADGAFRGFRWKRGVMTDLGSVPGYDSSNTGGINAKGQIAGWAYNGDSDAPSHAVLWDKDGPGIDLNIFVPPGSDLELTEANSINDRGEVVGTALLPNGDAHVFLLTPTERDFDADAAAPPATGPAVAGASRKSPNASQGNVAPDMLSARRARLAHNHRGFALRLPNQTH